MTADHVPGNPLMRFSNPYYGPFGFFTAALGFVFLSGLVAGLVYDRHRVTHGVGSMIRRILRRIRDLYITQMIIFLTLVAAVSLHLSGAGRWHLEVLTGAPWKGLFFGSFLLYEPGYLGILPMYCFFLALTPIVLWQFQKGNARYVLGISILLWAVSGLLIRLPENPEGVDFGAFNPLGYQLLFIVGLAFGTGRLNIDRLSSVTRKRLIAASLGVAALFFVLRQQYAIDGPANPFVHRLANSFSAVELGPLRLLSFAAFGVVLYSIFRNVEWGRVHSRAFRWLAFVGRHSLPVFAWSILATYAAVALFPSPPGELLGMLVVLVAVMSLAIPAQVHAMLMRRRDAPFPAGPKAFAWATRRFGSAPAPDVR
jgi:hypothetical protein